ncbi:hypothetical protein KDW41_13405 [Burkholderia vietnamiensis]|uniref:hypothetical protein n=1 Tax=Burkholderia latens TaxID=488446 RepID=UPI001AE77748|nr:hypothetical protein [Burkholderia latens]MBR7961438.1 hypothetical protein [Burkholderia vietnamiensis]QTO49349.1 hypothetical protein J8I86_05300 [Burkholderia latens]
MVDRRVRAGGCGGFDQRPTALRTVMTPMLIGITSRHPRAQKKSPAEAGLFSYYLEARAGVEPA